MDEREIARALGPLTSLDLIVSVDFYNEVIDVRSTSIYDLDYEKRIIVAQTNPPILHSMVGQEVEASFVIYDREANRQRRFGFKTPILNVESEYEIRAGVIEPAITIGYPRGGVRECVVRLFYRVEPTTDSGLSAGVADDPGESHVIDLSLGGMMLSYLGPTEFNQGDAVVCDFKFQDQETRIDGEVRRVFEREGSKMVYLGIKFVDMDPETNRLVQTAVNHIMRAELKERSGLAYEEETLATPRITTR